MRERRAVRRAIEYLGPPQIVARFGARAAAAVPERGGHVLRASTRTEAGPPAS